MKNKRVIELFVEKMPHLMKNKIISLKVTFLISFNFTSRTLLCLSFCLTFRWLSYTIFHFKFSSYFQCGWRMYSSGWRVFRFRCWFNCFSVHYISQCLTIQLNRSTFCRCVSEFPTTPKKVVTTNSLPFIFFLDVLSPTTLSSWSTLFRMSYV